LLKALAILIVVVIAVPVFAENDASGETAPARDGPERPWGGEGELGYVKTTGNTDTTSLNARMKIAYLRGKWTHELAFESLFSEDSGVATSERYVGDFKSIYSITERGYLFGRAEYVDDRFAGFNYQITEVAGYGRKIVETEKLALNLEAGPGGRHSKREDGDKEDELILYAGGVFSWKLSETAGLEQEATTNIGEDNTQTESITSLKVRIIGNFALKTSYTVRHNSSPPAGSRSTDTILSVTLVYSL
jgi:putative salt-induced outer membrane protein